MKPFGGYENAKPYTEAERLPVGGYVLKILDCEEKGYSWGNVLVISFDIIEGEHKDFFRRNYSDQKGEDRKWKGTYRLYEPRDDGSEKDEWTIRRFKTVITDIEESNKGYHWDWDERTLKGKLIGGIFNNKEYEVGGRHGFYTSCYGLTSVDNIRSGKYKIPADTLLKKDDASRYTDMSFMDISDDLDEELPFK